jgi:hypothetical protein
LCKLRSSKEIILYLSDGPIRVQHAEVEDRTDLHRDVVSRDDVLGRNIHRDRAQIHPDHFLNERDHINDSGTAGRDHAPKPKNHSALIFLHDFDPADDQDHNDDAECSRWSD